MRLRLIVAVLALAADNVAFAAETTTSTSVGLSLTALVPVYAAVVGALGGLAIFFVQRRDKAKADKEAAQIDQRQRQRELALKIVENITKEEESVGEEKDEYNRRGTMARRFAIGLLKIESVGI